jgi:hypothetical protein
MAGLVDDHVHALSAELRALDDAYKLRRQRDVEAGMVRGLLEQLDGRRGERIALLALARRDGDGGAS